jgi:hypothetical protein
LTTNAFVARILKQRMWFYIRLALYFGVAFAAGELSTAVFVGLSPPRWLFAVWFYGIQICFGIAMICGILALITGHYLRHPDG